MSQWKFHESIHLVIHSPGIGPTRRGGAIDTPNSPVIRSFADPTSNKRNCKMLDAFGSQTGCDRLTGQNVKHNPEVMCLKGLKSTTFSDIVIWCGFSDAFHFLGPRQVSRESSTVSLWVLLDQWPKPWLLLNRGLYYPAIQALWQTPIRIPTNHLYSILEYHVQGYQEKAVAEVDLGARQCTSWSTVPTRLLLGRIRPVLVVALVSSSEVSQNPAAFQGLEVWGTGKMYKDTVDGRIIAPVEVGSLSHYLKSFIHPRWCKVSSINGIVMIQTCLVTCTLSSNYRAGIIHWKPCLNKLYHLFRQLAGLRGKVEQNLNFFSSSKIQGDYKVGPTSYTVDRVITPISRFVTPVAHL